MGKISISAACLVMALAATSAAAEKKQAEIGYERGTLGFEALMTNDNERALRQLEAARNVKPNDPARLINLGSVHARLGDKARARQAFEAAANCREHFDLVLANGKVMDSRKAAMLALRSLEN